MASNLADDQRPQLQYQQLSVEEEAEIDEEASSITPDPVAARRIMWNFALMSICFSANHAAVVSCLSLVTSRLGSTGAWQVRMDELTNESSRIGCLTNFVNFFKKEWNPLHKLYSICITRSHVDCEKVWSKE